LSLEFLKVLDMKKINVINFLLIVLLMVYSTSCLPLLVVAATTGDQVGDAEKLQVWNFANDGVKFEFIGVANRSIKKLNKIFMDSMKGLNLEKDSDQDVFLLNLSGYLSNDSEFIDIMIRCPEIKSLRTKSEILKLIYKVY
jgi:hypothetical protein